MKSTRHKTIGKKLENPVWKNRINTTKEARLTNLKSTNPNPNRTRLENPTPKNIIKTTKKARLTNLK